MKSKDKQIRELQKKKKEGWRTAIIVTFVFGFLWLATAYIQEIDESKLEQQLESCQEKVPVWTFNYTCDWSAIGLISEGKRIHTTLEKYEDDLDFYRNTLTCEVIE